MRRPMQPSLATPSCQRISGFLLGSSHVDPCRETNVNIIPQSPNSNESFMIRVNDAHHASPSYNIDGISLDNDNPAQSFNDCALPSSDQHLGRHSDDDSLGTTSFLQSTSEHENVKCNTSSHDGDHFSVSEKPARCNCGVVFTKKCSLQRHVAKFNRNNDTRFPCPECEKYQGKRAFKRKDHLVQHLRVFHAYGEDQLSLHANRRPLAEMFSLFHPFCHFADCDYYRDTQYSSLGFRLQRQDRPFDRQSDYTAHMKKEHDWSPISCDFPGCDKVGGKGFYTFRNFNFHRRTKHSQQNLSKDAEKQYGMACQLCQQRYLPAELWPHLSSNCKADTECKKCHARVKQCNLYHHLLYICGAIVDCGICNQSLPQKDMDKHLRDAHWDQIYATNWET
ncbi:hypothetical protein GGR57DRAFT_366984 [Xylariaceae sp. FL1272]|nr:hypothetical protein GGR57DRAFT_366984 [Xylariaceae sp. FL1272]